MTDTQSTPAPDGWHEKLEILRSPCCLARLAVVDAAGSSGTRRGSGAGPGASALACAQCGAAYPIEDGVFRLVQGERTDDFYEGRYLRQIGYVPGRNRTKDWLFFNLIQSGVFGELRRALPGGRRARVLDLAGAAGVRWLGETAQTIGLELSLSAAKAAAPIYDISLQADMTTLPLEDVSIDLVWGSYFYEHLEPQTKDRVLREIGRVLRPGGACILQFDCLSSNALTRYARRDTARYEKGFVDHDGHVGLEPLPSALDRMRDAGFTVTRVTKFGTTALQYPSTYSWLGIAYGDQVRWVRWLAAAADRGLSGKRGLAFELGVTVFDRTLSPIVSAKKATRAIVALRRPWA